MSAGASITPPTERVLRRGRLTVIDPPALAAEPVCALRGQPVSSAGDGPQRSDGRDAARHGPLVAVCGLSGGAGASTLAYLIACAEQGHHRAGAVLVADTGGPGSQLAAYAGVQAPRSLTEAAQLAAASEPVGQLVAAGVGGLRVLSCGPRFGTDCCAGGVSLLLDHARAHYALSVIDCGTLARQADQIALAHATHVCWVLAATGAAARAAQRVLEHVHPALPAAQMIVARHEPERPKAPMRVLRILARQRQAPLILMPAVGDLADVKLDDALDISQVSLQAIHDQLAR